MIDKTLGHYKVLDKLGEGGMGEVYRAEDTKLGREVAIKVLPEAVAQDPERLARFEREAKVLAALNHPNIAAIYSLESAATINFLVMELAHGEDLSDRISRGPIAAEDSLAMAIQIAAAMEAAHEQGIVHRDLKPANIKVDADGKVKVLDFGLAKALDTGSASEINLSFSPTLTAQMTQAGVVLGTAAYMSPEQARGKTVDRRTDLWAFACVLYEALSGHRAFGGETLSDINAAILTSEPDWTALGPGVRPGLLRLLRRCLEKDPQQRLRDAGDLRLELEEIAAGDESDLQTDDSPSTRGGSRPWIAAALLLAGLGLGVLIGWGINRGQAPPTGLQRLAVTTDEPNGFRTIGISPDGQSLLYTTDQGLHLRPIDSYQEQQIIGGRLLAAPAWSPDARWLVGYRRDDEILGQGELLKISADGSGEISLSRHGTNPYGLAWIGDSIYAGMERGRRLIRVPANGGPSEDLITTDSPIAALGAINQIEELDNRYAVMTFSALSLDADGIYSIHSVALDGSESHPLIDSGYSPRVLGDVLLFLKEDSLIGARLEGSPPRIVGGHVPLLADVTDFGVSDQGTLAYLPVSDSTGSEVLIVDREGQVLQTLSEEFKRHIRFSPDGSRVSIVTDKIVVRDLVSGAVRPLDPGPGGIYDQVWTPDGKAICYAAEDGDMYQIRMLRVDETAAPEVLIEVSTAEAEIFPTDWTPDGSMMIYARYSADQTDLWLLPADGSGPRPLLETEASEDLGRISPDGNWLAYEANHEGNQEIYVRAWDSETLQLGAEWKISDGGGRDPIWNRDGGELFYEDLEDRLIAVAVIPSATNSRALVVGSREVLFDLGAAGYATLGDESYDSASGGRFVFARSSRGPREARVVVGWAAEMKRRMAEATGTR